MMSLIAGIALLACSVLLYLLLRWGAGRPQEPVWMRENLTAMVHTPLLVGMFAFGLAFLTEFIVTAA